ncbi:MAG: short chain dehydrogenase [Chitinophagaceae bacterium]|nr:short chain dehydrogenase [Chitinophagaceae bacterium]
MKILIIGASGAIGKLIEPELSELHEVITAGRNSGDVKIDSSLVGSIHEMFESVKNTEACVCLAGGSCGGDLLSLTEDRVNMGIKNKLLGQVNLVLIGQNHVTDNGSFTLISGKMGDQPSKNAADKALVNGGINSFVMAASLEMQRGIRINVISPSKVADIPVEDLVAGYLRSIEGTATGEIIKINY